METWGALERQREEMVGIYVRQYDCHKCRSRNTVVETRQAGSLIGECTECGALYLDPDWDAMGKEPT